MSSCRLQSGNLKRQRQAEQKSSTRFIDTRFVLPTSNLAERLFSLAKRVYNPHRRNLHPRTLQALLSLNQNRSVWNLPMFAKIDNEPRSGRDDDDEESSEEY
jgi:hypothetical protein